MEKRGFTLIELLMVLAIVAILAAIAYPSYLQYLIRSNRSVAKADLMELQQWMERNYSLTNSYNQVPGGVALSMSSLPFSTSPRYQGSNPQYQISFSSGPSATAYTLQSVPQSNQNDTECGTLTLSSAGVRGATGTSTTCWSN